MQNTIFITVAGGLVQSIEVTDDLDPHVIVIDFEKDTSKEFILYKYKVDKISDGDYQRFEEMIRRCE